MKKFSTILFICIAVLVIGWNNNFIQAADKNNFEEDQLDALSFLIDKRVYKQFKTKCEEQKREAKAAYEARCEPSIHIRLTDKAATKKRYCPELKNWPAFIKYEVN